MAHRRSSIAGMTDYTCVGLGDLLEDLKVWREATQETIDELSAAIVKVDSQAALLDDPKGVKAFLAHFIGLFGRYHSEFGRLLTELPTGVSKSHVEAVGQIYESARNEERHCALFSERRIDRALKAEELRPLLDDIYSTARGMLADLSDLSNVAGRLKSLVGTSLGQVDTATTGSPSPQNHGGGNDNQQERTRRLQVFVIYGRNRSAYDAVCTFLLALGLKPLPFEDVRAETRRLPVHT